MIDAAPLVPLSVEVMYPLVCSIEGDVNTSRSLEAFVPTRTELFCIAESPLLSRYSPENVSLVGTVNLTAPENILVRACPP